VRGNTRTERRVVLRYLPFKPGGVFDVDDSEVELSRYRLLGTGFFRDVQFSLKKGSARGLVVLVVDVTERNTIVINDVSMGLAADGRRDGSVTRLSGYAGLDVAETNLAGTGITLGGAMAVAEQLPGHLGAALLGTARDAFVEALQVSAAISAAIVLGLAIAVVVVLRRARPGSASDGQADVEAGGAVAA
jgi:hypothetical protein